LDAPKALEARGIPEDIASSAVSASQPPATADPVPGFQAPPIGPATVHRPVSLRGSAQPAEAESASAHSTPAAQASASGAPEGGASPIQQSIARIHEACQAPPMAPHEYRLLFELMAKEISENDLIGAQTLTNITQRAQERGLDVRRDDVRFILEVVSEADPWFEQGASANLFAGRFRNFVVARCRGQGLNLSADELDLIDAWFAGGALPQSTPQIAAKGGSGQASSDTTGSAPQQQGLHSVPAAQSASRWRSQPEESRAAISEAHAGSAEMAGGGEDFPRIVRTRMRG
jgi:hypothetical protein